MLYNCGRIFFILSFFVDYILSFGLVRLRTIRLSARVGAHIEHRSSLSRGDDVTITDVIIKTADRKWDWGCEWRHIRKRWAEDFGWFLTKTVSWDLKLDKAGWFLRWARPVLLGLRDASREVGSDGTVSIAKIESLSSCWKPKRQEVNKSFVPEQRESSVLRAYFGIPMPVNVSRTRMFYRSVYFTYQYVSHILIFDMLHHYGWLVGSREDI